MRPPALVLALLLAAAGTALSAQSGSSTAEESASTPPAARFVQDYARTRLEQDLEAIQTFRPAYPFWRHIFTIPDGRIAFGSSQDGRLLVVFPATGDWTRDGTWADPTLAQALDGAALPKPLDDRREQVVRLLEPTTGPLVHNPTRGMFLLPNEERYGGFLREWGAIYERFGVPAEVGLSQAILESGLDGRARSRARALGFCQWLKRNWDFLNRLTPVVLEAYNQTTQAPYCAAYLSILSTMYGSFIPALSEHHAGGVNVGRTVINGQRLGGTNSREQYFLGSEFAASLRGVSIDQYRDLFRTYGPRSSLYAEMVFGNMVNVTRITEQHRQVPIFAMRTRTVIPMTEITRRTGLKTDEVRRFNPALVKSVPAKANLYLPKHVQEFGQDVAFWHRTADATFASTMAEFLRIEAGVERWHQVAFEATLKGFQERFAQTKTEEGQVMATTLAYVISDLRTSRRAAILEDFRTNPQILDLFRRGAEELGATLGL